jgi:HEAT repeat protein
MWGARTPTSLRVPETIQPDSFAVSAPQRPVDYSGRPIGPLRLARAMRLNIAGGICILMALAVLWPTAPITIVFLREHLGADNTLIGLNLTLVILATTASLPGAWLFSGIQRRRDVWVLLTALARMCMFGPAFVVLLADHTEWHGVLVWVFILSLLLVNAGGVFTSPGWWSWMGDLIPESLLGAFFGRRYCWILLAQSLAVIVAGLALDWFSGTVSDRTLFFVVFAVAATLAVADPLLFRAVPEPVRPKPPVRTLGMIAREYLEPIRDRAFRPLLIAGGLYGFFFNMPTVFLVLFLRGEQIGPTWIGGQASLWLLSLVTVTFAVATALTANLWGRLADRIGHRTVWILASLGFFTHAVFLFVNRDNFAWLALLNAAVFGAFFSGQPVASQNLALSMAPAQRREFYISIYLAVTAVMSALGPLLGGWLADRYHVFETITLPSGQPACYIHLVLAITLVGMVLTLPLMVRVPDPKGTAVALWAGRLLSGDLLRVAWNISVLGSASGSQPRLRALRRISHRDGNVMLPEIRTALDDSDVALRREALLALGRLGTPEAMDLLRWHLYEPDGATRAQSVEAIGGTRVADRSTLLRRALRDEDSRVRRAAVEAIGRSGDQAAAEHLRHLLTDEHDGEVLASAAMVLSRLREFGAVREMLDLALHSANSTVRAQMLVALADLLGETGDFQNLWRQDRTWRGSGFAKLTTPLRRQARALVRMGTAAGPRSRAERRQEIALLDGQVEEFLEHVQAENWVASLTMLRRLALQLTVLRYRYQGKEEDILEFVSAVAPDHAQRCWLVVYLQQASADASTPEAPWDGLTLLAAYVLVSGQPPL